ncbi:MAG TPA: hypothetical protein VN328_02165 [Thermodesulfovibrionales bacterium]|nr:hypothetical protein [Thermodesulfovibrionales bacterium]
MLKLSAPKSYLFYDTVFCISSHPVDFPHYFCRQIKACDEASIPIVLKVF